jgi:hypothetical protein
MSQSKEHSLDLSILATCQFRGDPSPSPLRPPRDKQPSPNLSRRLILPQHPRQRHIPNIRHPKVCASAGLLEDIPHLLLREAMMRNSVPRRIVPLNLAVREEVDDHQHTSRSQPLHQPLSRKMGIVKVLCGWNAKKESVVFVPVRWEALSRFGDPRPRHLNKENVARLVCHRPRRGWDQGRRIDSRGNRGRRPRCRRRRIPGQKKLRGLGRRVGRGFLGGRTFRHGRAPEVPGFSKELPD